MHYLGAGTLDTRLADTLDDALKENIYLGVGECVKDLDGGYGGSWIARYVRTVPCTEPHLYQVYANFDVPYQDGDPSIIPDQEYIDKVSRNGCDDRFWDAIDEVPGVEYEIAYLPPSSQAWNSDRETTCLVGLPGGTRLKKSIVSG
ncbi:hypothetical protein BJF79_06080 [Actinomadura sp. CNU-125]|nr:hypothetical protein BJF79_06080 [Actinomadura sp. CNU-125]